MIFQRSDTPRIFALPPGVDFPQALVDGLRERLDGHAPHEMARVTLIVNTRRMARRIRRIFDEGSAGFLPRVLLLTQIGDLPGAEPLPDPVPPLRLRLELAQMVRKLLDQTPALAARKDVFALAEELVNLMQEMLDEDVSFDDLRALDVSETSGYWQQSLAFIQIAETYLNAAGYDQTDAGRIRRQVEQVAQSWAKDPPQGPIILAGSTGSRGPAQLLMRAVARLPQGAIVLPGFDFCQPSEVWDRLGNALTSEDHPQYRFKALADALQMEPGDISAWHAQPSPAPARNALLSLALRPAPITDAWMTEGPSLADLDRATEAITLLEAPTPRVEAVAIALRLRMAVEDGQPAALITPDRMLTRRVSACLDQWGILPDDSAGMPLHLSAPGRFLRMVAQLFLDRLSGENLLALLKHPLTHSDGDRGPHLLATRELELHLRRNGPPFPDAPSLSAIGERLKLDKDWTDWAVHCFCNQVQGERLHLTEWVDLLRSLSERIAAGASCCTTTELWAKAAGQTARDVIDQLTSQAPYGGELSAYEFSTLLADLLQAQEVRDRDAPDPRVMIWGTLEARVQGADLVILAGLNEGTWPETPSPDPWLNRRMRVEAGLHPPDRRIGLSAHDFQQAAAAPEVWFSRSHKSDDAETVPARWLNRVTNLLNGLDKGRPALAAMRSRGSHWLDLVDAFETVAQAERAPRPAPCPPVEARPRRLSVTEIKRLIRNPYEIYAKHVLRLEPLDPLRQEPDARLRGILLHKCFENFVKSVWAGHIDLTPDALVHVARSTLDEAVPWPVMRRLWLAKLSRIAGDFVAAEEIRQKAIAEILTEQKAEVTIPLLDFTLTARADRIDRTSDNAVIIYDYKSGKPPSEKEQKHFDLQLFLEAAMADLGGFANIPATPVQSAVFLGIGSQYEARPAPFEETPPMKVWEDLQALIATYNSKDQGYTAQLYPFKENETGPYDQLARRGEWDRTALAVPMVVL